MDKAKKNAKCLRKDKEHLKNANLRLQFASDPETISQFAKAPTFDVHQPLLITQSPNPSWKPGQNQPSPYGNEFIEVDPKKVNGVYSLLISGVSPRPIAFVSSINKSGQVNLSPFSYFNAISHAPPMVMFSVCRNRDGTKKDTLRNIEETKEFVVNIMSEWFLESANYTCGNFEYTEDEFEKSGLTKQESKNVKPPRVLESAFQMECKLRSFEDIYKNELSDEKSDPGKVSTTVVIGKIVKFHINKAIYDEQSGTVDFLKYKPVSRLGNINYGFTQKITLLPRPHLSKKS